MQSLKLFDEFGIAYFAEDASVIRLDISASKQLISDCYTPFGWDTLALRAKCRHSYTGRPHGRTWIFAILKHPLAYAEHRLFHFNSELFFIVPRHHADWRLLRLDDPDDPASPAPERKDPTTIGKIVGYLSPDGGMVTPMFALVVGFVVLVLRVRTLTRQPSQLEIATLCLVVSGILVTLWDTYSSAYQLLPVITIGRWFRSFSWGDVRIRRAPAVWVALAKGVGLHHPDTRHDAGRGCCCACNMRRRSVAIELRPPGPNPGIYIRA